MRVLSLRRWRRLLALGGGLLACAGLLALASASRLGAGGVLTVDAADREAYSRIVWAAVPPEAQGSVAQGRGLVRQTWVVSPSLDPGIAGLGPTCNRPACTACHARNGGGAPPDSAAEPMRSLLVRLSVPGQDAHGGPRSEPRYGDQLNEQGVPGVPGEGEAVLQWAPVPVTLADGTVITLRRPHLSFQHLAFGPMAAAVQTSVRVAPPMVGLGLLEAVPEADLLALAEAQRRAGQGVAGQPNRVWDAVAGRTVLGRFGWKANQPSVRQQVAGALAGDMGITTPVFPTPNCPPTQTACAAWSADRHPELADGGLDAMTRYLQVLGVPARREADAPRVRRGEALFAQAGCAACHQPVLHTGRFDALPALSDQTIHPYTDLLLHDLGPDLADGRPDYQASGRQWRTPPLWGLGLRAVVDERVGLLHDGRARDPLEAVLWHSGEAAPARAAVVGWSAEDRAALLAFLASL
ncbi:c-type cytochrome [Ideonella sp. B7]|uniref:di-heme oxidoreductase family protein n=1 Tax=Ideonella benzenivorans TaxID=2831643 RepID=UPI001CEC4517|nr:di-heme oxidoredictase family protein [Ideonella benzenivorans]MCA6218653.1 c-type cytochrome [Ideonella benzenivorans]